LLILWITTRDAIGAAACIAVGKFGQQTVWQRRLPDTPRPTNQRAELSAIILALEEALQKSSNMNNVPFMDVKIYTDSTYAYKCMTVWKERWLHNDFTAATGQLVVNRDLMRQAYDLQEDLQHEGSVGFVWVPSERNQDADAEVSGLLDEMEQDS